MAGYGGNANFGSAPYQESALRSALRMAAVGAGAARGLSNPLANFAGGFSAADRQFGVERNAAAAYAFRQAMMEHQQRQEDMQAGNYASEASARSETARHNLATETQAAQKPVGPRAYGEQPWYNDPSVKDTPGAIAARKKADTITNESISLSPAALDMTAQMYAKTGVLPSLGMKASGVREKILERAATNYPGVDVAGDKAAYGADQASLKNLQGNYDQTVAFGNTFEKNAQPLEAMVKSIPNLPTRFGNRVGRWAASQAGSPRVAQFHAQMGVVRPEAQRILQFAGTGGNMALTDSQAKDMKAILGDDFTPAQLRGALSVLRLDRNNKLQSYSDQINAIKSRIGRGTQPGKTVNWKMDASGNLTPSQ